MTEQWDDERLATALHLAASHPDIDSNVEHDNDDFDLDTIRRGTKEKIERIDQKRDSYSGPDKAVSPSAWPKRQSDSQSPHQTSTEVPGPCFIEDGQTAMSTEIRVIYPDRSQADSTELGNRGRHWFHLTAAAVALFVVGSVAVYRLQPPETEAGDQPGSPDSIVQEPPVLVPDQSPESDLRASEQDANDSALYQRCGSPITVSGPVHQLAFNNNGSQLAVTSTSRGANTWIVDPTTGDIIHVLTGHEEGVIGAAFSPDGTLLATSSSDGTARIWDTTTGQERALIRHIKPTGSDADDFIFAVAFNQDGTLLATAGADGTAQLWTPEGEHVRTLEVHSRWVTSIVFNGSDVITGSSDGTVSLFDLDSGEQRQVLTGTGQFYGVDVSPDGDFIAATVREEAAGAVSLWDATAASPVATLPAPTRLTYETEFSPDGSLIGATSDGFVQLFSLTGELVQSFPAYAGDYHGLAFSPDGEQFAIVSSAGEVELFCTDPSPSN